ncbi:hypothetical protein DFH27DRAFT_567113 [Peziza echinospora]|nr:hypothetical protein DFH27DRAFT_567113 [Peziza echinospora]
MRHKKDDLPGPTLRTTHTDPEHNYLSEGALSTGSNMATPSSTSGSPVTPTTTAASASYGLAGSSEQHQETVTPRELGKEIIEGATHVDVNKLATELEKMSNVDPNAVLRGAQLTIVGAYRALQNPALFRSAHYKQALKAVLAGILIRILISIPILALQIALFVIGKFTYIRWAPQVLSGIRFFEESVLQVPLFVMSLMRHFVPTLDEVFMLSLQWADVGLVKKHIIGKPAHISSSADEKGNVIIGKLGEGVQFLDEGKNKSEVQVPEDIGKRLYYPTLSALTPNPNPPLITRPHSAASVRPPQGSPLKKFLFRSLKKAGLSLAIYVLTFLPFPLGGMVVPLSTLYSLHKFLGLAPAVAVSLVSYILLPKSTGILLLQTYFASRHLVNDLLSPYFSRLPFTPKQKQKWFRDREGVLFGFGVGFLLLVRLRLVGVLFYGIAEASTAYLVTKITEPIPREALEGDIVLRATASSSDGGVGVGGSAAAPGNWTGWEDWCERQTVWRNKKEFLAMPVEIVEVVNGWVKKVNDTPVGAFADATVKGSGGERVHVDVKTKSSGSLDIPGGY